MIDRKLEKERAWSMHCRGMAVPEIAAALKTTNTEVRFYITEHWAEDKEEHEIEMGGSL